MKTVIRIATRKSPLAMWQAEHVKLQLLKLYPELTIEFVGITTEADKFLDVPLSQMGGKGSFVKELETSLLEHRADIAVHSIKDMPANLPDGLLLAVICERDDPRDTFISNHFNHVAKLPQQAAVGTSSLRRQAQLAALRPDLRILPLRGNVGTRLEKLDRGEFSAIILAAAGLKRLNQLHLVRSYFDPKKFVPAIGQGAIGIECRTDDPETLAIIKPLDHTLTRVCVTAERSMNAQFGGNCYTPIAAYATLENNRLLLHGLIGKTDGSVMLNSIKSDLPEKAEQLGIAVAKDLFSKGAKELLES
jgi:hydroxymethylbilane synthase